MVMEVGESWRLWFSLYWIRVGAFYYADGSFKKLTITRQINQ